MKNTLVIFKRELRGYFATPIAYIFLAFFLALTGWWTWSWLGFYERNQADLVPFFTYHPFFYLLLIPALSMRLWAEERRGGSIELLLTLPITTWQAVMGKFLAAWCFTGIALAFTFSEWITVNYLGDPDNLVILASYLGSLLMAGGFLAIGSCISAATKNQVIAFVVSLVATLVLTVSGMPMVLEFFVDWAPALLIELLRSISFWTHFSDISKGVIDLRDLVYFASLIGFFLLTNVVIVDAKKAT